MNQNQMPKWIEALLEVFDLCCLGRTKTPKPPDPEPVPHIHVWEPPQFGPPRIIHTRQFAELEREIERVETPPDPRQTEWWSDYTLTEIESTDSEEEDEGPSVYIIVVDKYGNERRIDPRRVATPEPIDPLTIL